MHRVGMDISWHSCQLVQELQKLQRLPDELLYILQMSPNSQYLNTLAGLALDPSLTSHIYAIHEDIFVELSSRWLVSPQTNDLNALAAYARILPSAPHLAEHATALLTHKRDGILEILTSPDVTALRNLPNDHLHTLLLTLCRLLMFDNARFMSYVSPAKLQVLLNHEERHVRYLGIRLLCLYLHASDKALDSMVKINLGDHKIEGPWEKETIDYTFFSLWERKRLGDLENQIQAFREQFPRGPGYTNGLDTTRIVQTEDLSVMTAHVGGVLVPLTSPVKHTTSSIKSSATMTENLRRLADGINTERPLMLTGLPGAGKTKLVKEIALALGKNSSMVTLHLNEQTDAKMLIGMYKSAQTPGSFSWCPGVLTTAVTEGRWILLEDIDRAPIEVISTLLPLIERGELLVQNWGESIRAAPGFRLLATVTTDRNMRGQELNPAASMIGLRHWLQVRLQVPSTGELSEIIAHLYPLVRAHIPKMMKLYTALASRNHPTNSRTKPMGPQDLLRWSRRICALLHESGITSDGQPLSEAVEDNIFLEAIDCFTGYLPHGSLRFHLATLIAQELYVPEKRAQHILEVRKPLYLHSPSSLRIGRALNRNNVRATKSGHAHSRFRSTFVMTDHVLRVLESVLETISHAEPCLLVGETGTGKTTIVQQLAVALGYDLTVVNLSQQSEAGDLLGGYKPVNLRSLAILLKEEVDELLRLTIPSRQNQKFRDALAKAVLKGEWVRVSKFCQEALRISEAILLPSYKMSERMVEQPQQKKRKRRRNEELKDRWSDFAADVRQFEMYLTNRPTGFAFSFVESHIVKAARNGDWVLLDEINMASPDTLESLADLFSRGDDDEPSLLLAETGNVKPVTVHKDFRIFGAMNPATDVGKRDLAPSIRSRFTEIFVEAPDKTLVDLVAVVNAYLGNHSHSDVRVVPDIATLYLEVKGLTDDNKLIDGAKQKPHFSLRTLTRTLVYVTDIAPIYGLRRSLYEGFSMSFLTSLNVESRSLVQNLLIKHILYSQKNHNAVLNQNVRVPEDGKRYVQFRHYWLAKGSCALQDQPHYIITPFVEQNLLNLVRATSTRRFPVLLQGPTSSGKTSMVEYLARISGNKFVRINNHEHTDLQEYLGTYVSGIEGRLEYQDGILVKALKEGHWIVLDELNLAPTDVLEALNRLLDDNRELLIPETQQVIRPHNDFMLFATQNPPGMYGGRKTLSRAFRNRFLEIHFDDIPEDELETILRERSQIAPSFCSRIVSVYNKLSILRQSERLFEQKNSFATLRDLFRWALRDADDRQQLAVNGFMLLAERVRKESERITVKKTVEETMKVQINENQIYSYGTMNDVNGSTIGNPHGVIWTKSMRRLYVIITQALKNKEPVLLVGETGCGKTTICQAIAEIMKKELHVVNAHQNMETGDLIGAQRPLRNRVAAKAELIREVTDALKIFGAYEDKHANDARVLTAAYDNLLPQKYSMLTKEARDRIEAHKIYVDSLFEWSDGSLVTAMKRGDHFLLDEISLAEDSVLERLNSVLEPSRTLNLAEKGSADALVSASDGFQLLATMNPGGDYGKRELSPALRNRFTEIWVPPLWDEEEVLEIVEAKLHPAHNFRARPMVDFGTWFATTYDSSASHLSLRDLISWIAFLNTFEGPDNSLAVLHGASMVYLDRLGANPTGTTFVADANLPRERQICISKLEELFGGDFRSFYDSKLDFVLDESQLKIGTFHLSRTDNTGIISRYSLEAPTTLKNAMKILRALQVGKPVLLEGSPGVGKTTLVAALAERVGIPLTRINLSDQTDLMDLFGCDVPMEGTQAGHFGWRDAPFLRAMQNGEWVLLDEMNLASQAILEGLNACFDHRGEVYVPELDQTFVKHPDFVVFAAQNPYHQGGGRKGLPTSFVNRFTTVYAEGFSSEDLQTICAELFPDSDTAITEQLIQCVSEINSYLQEEPSVNSFGGPWEVNLRDVIRWLHLIRSSTRSLPVGRPAAYQQLLFVQRFRRLEDQLMVSNIIKQSLDDNKKAQGCFVAKDSDYVEIGLGLLPRDHLCRPEFPRTATQHSLNLPIAESVMLCIEQKWPTLLVGPSGSGKTSMILHLASLAGVDVIEICLHPDIDTMDLVGGFEQMDINRESTNFVRNLRKYTQQFIAEQMTLGNAIDTTLLKLESSLQESTIAQDLIAFLCSLSHSLPSSRYPAFLTELQALSEPSAIDNRANFEWVDGMLVKALKQGKWLILDHANLCNPSVLDRLNSLLEPNGFLSINEHRDLNGIARIVKPHADFRLFITTDPQHGELSRAMRNRSVELFMPPRSLVPACDPLNPEIESSIARFALFNALNWNEINDDYLPHLMSIYFDHLSLKDCDLLQRWQLQVNNGMTEMSQLLQVHFNGMVKIYHGLCSSDSFTMKAIRYAYRARSSNIASLAGIGALQVSLWRGKRWSQCTDSDMPINRLFIHITIQSYFPKRH